MTDKEVIEDMTDEEVLNKFLNVPFLFGLRAQGHIPTVERMLAEGKTWDEIGQAIGWLGYAVEEHWGKELKRREKESKE
jgi:hypothetical protein